MRQRGFLKEAPLDSPRTFNAFGFGANIRVCTTKRKPTNGRLPFCCALFEREQDVDGFAVFDVGEEALLAVCVNQGHLGLALVD